MASLRSMNEPDDVDLDHVDDQAEASDHHVIDPNTASAEGGGSGQAEWSRIDWYACAVIIVAAMALVSLHIAAYPTVSPVDETQHIDYMIKAGDLEFPNLREQIGQEAMREVACRTIDFPQLMLPACGLDSYDPNDFPDNGVNTATGQFPVYYLVTGLSAAVIAGLPGIESEVTAGRLVGSGWLAGAICVIWYLLALFAVPRAQRAIVCAIAMATPLVLFHASTINPDSVLLLTGSLALLAAVQFERGRFPGWGLIVTMIALIVVEPTNALPGALIVAYLGIRVTFDQGESARRRAVPLAGLVALLIARSGLYDRARSALPAATDDSTFPRLGGRPAYETLRVDGVSIERVASQVGSLFTPVDNLYRAPHFADQYIANVVQFTDWLLIGLLIAAFMVYVNERRSMTLAGLTIAALMAAGPLYTFYYAYFSSVDFAAPGRFGLPLVPALLVASATAIRTRTAVIVSASVAGLVVATTSTALLTA